MATRTYEIKEDDTIKIGGHKIIDDEKWFLKSKKTYKREDGDRTFGKYQKQGAFSATAEKIGKKMDAVLNDSNKTTKLLMALNTITESSKMEPLSSGRVKTPLGKITSGITKGLIQGKQIQSAETLSKAKYMKALTGPETIKIDAPHWTIDMHSQNLKDIGEKRGDWLAESQLLGQKYMLLQSIKDAGDIPTGRLEEFFLPFRDIANSLWGEGSSQYEAFSSMDPTKLAKLSSKDKLEFLSKLDAITMEQAIKKAKFLYPVSENDVKRLQTAVGGIGTPGAALAYLTASQMASSEAEGYYLEGTNKFLKELGMNKNADPLATVTIDGITANGYTDFALKYATAKLNEKYKDLKQEDIDKVYGNTIKREGLTGWQLAAIKYQIDLQPAMTKLDDQLGNPTLFRLEKDQDAIEKKADEIEKDIKKELKKKIIIDE
tara:strand:+ start:38 stop:1336 length:1299 start_codon:yes stop_codon:yes gene_type:complete